MKKLIDYFFSMQFALTLLAIFAVTIGTATIIENDNGTAAAKIIVYDATWFEVLLFLLAVSMTGNIFRNKLIQRKKYNVLIFHLAFVIILMGSAISRFIGYEGTMRIREGETSNKVITDHTYLQLRVNDGVNQFDFDERVMFSSFKKNRFSKTIYFGDKSCNIQFVSYIPNVAQTFIENFNGVPIIAIVTADGKGRHSNLLKEGESVGFGNYSICFNCTDTSNNSINITLKEGKLFFTSPIPVNVKHMESGITDSLEVKTEHTLSTRTLYSHDGNSFVVRSFIEKGEIKYVSAPAGSDHNLHNAVVLKITYEGKEEEAIIFGGKGYLGGKTTTQINGIDFTISYGAKIENLPFYIALRDFQLDRYPGSKSPSSFASEVTLIDPRYNIDEPRRIYMNNVLNYSGYRFFQSSYDQDEKGTILSVNHDQYGTIVTYIGYFLMSLGMLLHFFGKKSRFRALIRSSAKIREELKRAFSIIIIITLTFSAAWGAENEGDTIRGVIDKEHALSFGGLLVQGNDGRIEPMNTLTSELVRKVARTDKVNGLSADQVILGMVADPGYWQTVPMIKVSDPSLKELLGLEGKYASFNDFLDLNYGSYKISDYVDASYKKKPAHRTGFEKDVIKIDERVNICYMIYSGSLFRIFPKPGDDNNRWYAAEDAKIFDTADVVFIRHILPLYYNTINEAIASGNWEKAEENLGYIKSYQKKYGEQIFPNQKKIKLEILYNNINLFKKLFPLYSLAGFILLILLLITTIRRSSGFRVAIRIFVSILGAAFALHTAGLAARWYISGHAPWSNGYETMIYIAWATMASGFIFMKRSRITLAVTSVLASLTLMVANMSWMDPEITNLVPVLKSYWLIIHVAVITASYSFLAIGMILGFMVLVIISLANEKNYRKIKLTIKELTNVNEMNLTIGVVLLTIGTFLGGVWANESWGRYWGWDPKETWALVSILVYSFVIHMRMVPGLKGSFAFNFAALISFGAILMTYFGVNYYLSGLHSYAGGDPVPVPSFVYYTIMIVTFVSIFAFLKERRLAKRTS